MFCASASNVVVECIARSTPIITSRIPPVIEYLGADYPLYLDAIDPDLSSFTEQIRGASQYLDRLDRDWMSYDSFRRTFVDQLSKVEPEAFR
jgi:hypothetical protein